jgi:hypothetical protein
MGLKASVWIKIRDIITRTIMIGDMFPDEKLWLDGMNMILVEKF